MSQGQSFILELPDYSKITFPETDPIPMEQLVPDANEVSVSLFKDLIKYNQQERSSAENALIHKYFYTQPLCARLEDMPKLNDGNCTLV